MKLIHILPVSNLHYCNGYKMFMALTHLVENNEVYKMWLKRYDGYIILDNSIVELGGAVSLNRLCDAAEEIQADEIILPDVMEDGPATVALVKKNIAGLYKRYGKTWPFKIQAVVQGKTPEEIEHCFCDLANIPEVDVLGIPKHFAFKHSRGRVGFEYLWEDCKKEIHLLGLAQSFTELAQYADPEAIRSCDTSLMTVLLKEGKRVGQERSALGKIDFLKDFIEADYYLGYSMAIEKMLLVAHARPKETLINGLITSLLSAFSE